jgi:prefoldin subunit 1
MPTFGVYGFLNDRTNLPQILIQIQQTGVQSQRALNVSLQQTSVKDRERRILQLTIDEIAQMKGDVNLYKGVGKMYVVDFEIGTS